MTTSANFPKMTPAELKAAREELQLTQPEMAARFELSVSGYKKYELGLTRIPGPVRLWAQKLLADHRKK